MHDFAALKDKWQSNFINPVYYRIKIKQQRMSVSPAANGVFSCCNILNTLDWKSYTYRTLQIFYSDDYYIIVAKIYFMRIQVTVMIPKACYEFNGTKKIWLPFCVSVRI